MMNKHRKRLTDVCFVMTRDVISLRHWPAVLPPYHCSAQPAVVFKTPPNTITDAVYRHSNPTDRYQVAS